MKYIAVIALGIALALWNYNFYHQPHWVKVGQNTCYELPNGTIHGCWKPDQRAFGS